MTAAAISIIAPSTGHAVRRSSKGSDGDAGDSAPFASLLAAEPDAAAEAPAAEAGKPDEDGTDTTDATATEPDTETAPQLPAWLLALREPPPATPPVTAAVVADPAGADGTVKASTMLPGLAQDLNALRALKGRPGDTPPTQTPPLPAADGRAPVIGSTADGAPTGDDAATPLAFAALPAGEVTLDARQSAALDAALAKLDTGSAASITTTPATAPTPVAAERSAPLPAITPSAASEAAAASALSASLANQTDAFGEPLSLQGHDAALRLGERLRWLTASGVQEARIQLHPRELGSVDIRIRIEGQGASVWFGADHPGARAALEATLPQLRERLASEGLQLTQSSVGSQTQQQPGSNGQQQARPDADRSRAWAVGSRLESAEGRDSLAQAGARRPIARGLVDRYA